MSDDLIIIKDFAEIKQLGKEEQQNCVRMYCNQYPDVFTFQIRTFKPITQYGEGVPRQMIASVHLTIEELRKMLKYAEDELRGVSQ